MVEAKIFDISCKQLTRGSSVTATLFDAYDNVSIKVEYCNYVVLVVQFVDEFASLGRPFKVSLTKVVGP